MRLHDGRLDDVLILQAIGMMQYVEGVVDVLSETGDETNQNRRDCVCR